LARLAEVEADPEGAYQDHLAWIARKWHDSHGSATAFLEHHRRRATRPERGYRVRFIAITDAGRQRLTSQDVQQLTDEDSTQGLTAQPSASITEHEARP
jgi:hypothetical protein